MSRLEIEKIEKAIRENPIAGTSWDNAPYADTTKWGVFPTVEKLRYDLEDHVDPRRIPDCFFDRPMIKDGRVPADWLKPEDVDPNNLTPNLINEESKNMVNEEYVTKAAKSPSQRRVVTVRLFDDDPGLPYDDCLVAEYSGVVTEDSDQVTVQQVLLDYDVAGDIFKHNAKREEVVNESILQNTGREVMLRPIRLKDLRIEVVR